MYTRCTITKGLTIVETRGKLDNSRDEKES